MGPIVVVLLLLRRTEERQIKGSYQVGVVVQSFEAFNNLRIRPDVPSERTVRKRTSVQPAVFA
jgi:hypothetical protein